MGDLQETRGHLGTRSEGWISRPNQSWGTLANPRDQSGRGAGYQGQTEPGEPWATRAKSEEPGTPWVILKKSWEGVDITMRPSLGKPGEPWGILGSPWDPEYQDRTPLGWGLATKTEPSLGKPGEASRRARGTQYHDRTELGESLVTLTNSRQPSG